ncbi:MAG: SipW-dependent-type signal peptide-containing protein [Oscillospiraceae bacterium]|nr:SipW-dependent-type signal peptide-containing protein [Oscillospiraceae bacterium]
MKKKILAITLCVAMLAIMLVSGTLAYFTDNDAKTNTFTVGNVSIVLTEPKWDAEGAAEAFDVYPGEALAKDPTVTNDGKNPCFVRVSVTGWDALINAELSVNNITYRTDYVDAKLGENWVLHTDGYFYYTKVMQPADVTDALFDQIVIPTDVVNDATGAQYNLEVKAYAVQAQGAKPSFSAVQTMTVEEIAAWFATCGM